MLDRLEPHLFVGDHELIEPIGAGGFSVVWKARESETGRMMALKFPQNERFIEQLKHEANLSRRIDDPRVVPILESNLDADLPHLVLPLIDGRPLELLEDGCPPSRGILDGLTAARELADILARLHESGIVHGDIKPGNVLIDENGRIHLLDLGLARLAVDTRMHRSLAQSQVSVDGESIAGTLDYMAPELFDGQSPSGASDLYGLGVLLHHLLTGRPPAFGVRPQTVNPYLTHRIERLLARLLDHDPAVRHRFGGGELLREIDALIAAEHRCLARRHGHERRHIFQRRMGVLVGGLRSIVWVVAPLVTLVVVVSTLKRFGFLAWVNPEHDLWVAGIASGGVVFCLLGMILGITTLNAWILGVPERDYKKRPGHPLWSFMMQ